MEDSIYLEMWYLRLPGYATWAHQRTCGIPKMDQPHLRILYRHMLHNIPGRCPTILRHDGTIQKGCGHNYTSHRQTRKETLANEMRVSSDKN
jgi:hypothetical protein